MKKVISSKRFTNEQYNISSQDAHKQLLSNNWARRNDSLNVASALHAEHILNSPIKSHQDFPFKHNATGVFRKHCLGSNSCYCKETPVKPPALLRRPNKCLSLEEFEDRFKNTLSKKGCSSFLCFCTGNYASAEQVDSSQALLKRYQSELVDSNHNLQITDQRKQYEKFQDQEYEKYLRDVDQFRTLTIMSTQTPNRTAKSSEYVTEAINFDDLNLLTKSSQKVDVMEDEEAYDDEKNKLSNGFGALNVNEYNNNSMEEIETDFSGNGYNMMNTNDIKTFRNSNYFETHDLNKYEIGDSEKNRSSIFNKSTGEFSKYSNFSAGGVTPEKLKNITKCYQLGLVPKTLSISADSSIEIEVSEKDVYNYCHRFVGRYQKPHYMNTFALRQQKMTTYRS